jgi:hypothetical protein
MGLLLVHPDFESIKPPSDTRTDPSRLIVPYPTNFLERRFSGPQPCRSRRHKMAEIRLADLDPDLAAQYQPFVDGCAAAFADKA